MRSIYLKSGLGNETYAPPFLFDIHDDSHRNPRLFESAFEEAREGMFSAVDALLGKTQIHPRRIEIVIVVSGSFSPSPSLSSMLVNKYELDEGVRTFNLSGMGCSGGVVAVDMAVRLLSARRAVQYALVVITESISLNWYFGENRSMLVTNCIFRVGCAAALISNDPSQHRVAKFKLVDSLRTHHGSDDRAYRAAFQEEDEVGTTGISLTKDLIRVAGENLRHHITTLAPRVLPLGELIKYAKSVVVSALSKGELKRVDPDFTTAFEHMCIHTGGKAVIEQVGRVLRLSDSVTEPARMTLHRFGNTSSSLVFYELAYVEAKTWIKSGNRLWMLAFGTGFKVGSLVWISVRDSDYEFDNPWNDCIHRYPVKSCHYIETQPKAQLISIHTHTNCSLNKNIINKSRNRQRMIGFDYFGVCLFWSCPLGLSVVAYASCVLLMFWRLTLGLPHDEVSAGRVWQGYGDLFVRLESFSNPIAVEETSFFGD
ncbi:hypothetical protein Ancab_038597 [Ancistrocladus abbreviatus]